MSLAPTNRSSDLQRLRDEGYDLTLIGGMLVVAMPFVNEAATVGSGALVVPLSLRGERTASPARHDAFWMGGTPCDHEGKPLHKVVMSTGDQDLGHGIEVTNRLCNKPPGREFSDYHELVTAYAGLIVPHATLLRPSAANAQPMRGRMAAAHVRSPFRYMDTATARAGLGALASRFPTSVGIVGLGGTGSYVLDLVAKTPVETIHLYDDDAFLQHNAFRAPGAAAIEDLEVGRAKVDHFASVYSRMHTGIVPHRVRLERGCLDLLTPAGFVFLCIDDGRAKGVIIDRLERDGKSFIDVGIGLTVGVGGLIGSARVTTSTPTMRDHVRDKRRVALGGGTDSDPYATNIQVADLNALNAALAVLRWKRLIGFYADGSGEHHSVYDVDGNHLNNVDRETDA